MIADEVVKATPSQSKGVKAPKDIDRADFIEDEIEDDECEFVEQDDFNWVKTTRKKS